MALFISINGPGYNDRIFHIFLIKINILTFFNDLTDDNIELTEPIDFDYSSDESLGDHINYDPAMNAYSATSDSDVESPYDPERLSRYVSRMQREIELDTSDRGPYPLEIQPPTSIAYATTLQTSSLQHQQPSIHR